MTILDKQHKLTELYKLRRRVDMEIASLEASIDADLKAMERDRQREREAVLLRVPAPTEEMRRAHAAYQRGERSDWAVVLEREYQVLAKRRARVRAAQRKKKSPRRAA